MADRPDEPGLNLEMLDDIVELFDPSTIYYFDEPLCERVDKDGNDCLFCLPVLGVELWVMHPDHLPRFLAFCEAMGFKAVKFDWQEHGRRIKPTWEG